MQVEHPGDQGALQARPGPAEHVKARAGDLDALLEVDDAQRRAQVPVRLGLEVELAGSRPPCAARRSRLRPCRSGVRGSGRLGMLATAGVQLALPPGAACSSSAAMRSPTWRMASIFAWRSAGSFILPISFETALRSALSALHFLDQRRGAARPAPALVDRRRVHLAAAQRLAHQIGLLTDQVDDLTWCTSIERNNRNAPSPAGRGGARGATCVCDFRLAGMGRRPAAENRLEHALTGVPGPLTWSCFSSHPARATGPW